MCPSNMIDRDSSISNLDNTIVSERLKSFNNDNAMDVVESIKTLNDNNDKKSYQEQEEEEEEDNDNISTAGYISV